MRNTVFILLYALTLLGAADRAAESAQVPFGAIDARVIDKEGKPIPDASVRIEHTSGQSFQHRTERNGHRRFENIPAGTYTVTASAAGCRAPLSLVVTLYREQVLPVTLELTLQTPVSIVGYIDDAIVGSQIRIRFDAGFHVNFADRAEFFYARYAGLNNGPGPNAVLADLNFQQLYLQAEYAPRKRFSFFVEVPVRWIQPQHTAAINSPMPPPSPLPNVNEAGLSDLAAGFKLAAVASSNQYLTFQFQAYFPSGNASTGLGTNHYSVEPALLYYRRLSDRVALEAQVGDSHPIGGSFCPPKCVADPLPEGAPQPASGGFAGDVFFYGVGPSYVLYQGERVRIAPVIELVGWRVLGGLETDCVLEMGNSCGTQEGASANGTNIVNLKVGARTSIGRHNSFYVGFGHAVTRSHWYEEIVRAEYRYSF